MPIYEYRCDQCDHYMEKLQKISDAPLTLCPECGEDKMRKLVSAAAFQLKGTGWYETDFKDKKPGKDNKSSNGSKPASSSKNGSGANKADNAATSTKKDNSPAKTSTSASKSD